MQRLEIENLGKLGHADIRLGGLTLFAGPNNTGKSFVSKFLYSIFGAMKANPVAERMQRLIAPIQQSVRALDRGKHPAASAVLNAFTDMEKLARSFLSGNREAAEDLNYPLPYQIEKLKSLVQKMKMAVGELKGGQSEPTSELEYRVAQNLVKNFQIPEISQLKGRYDSNLHAKLGGDFQIMMSDGEVKLKLTSSSLRELSSLSNVVYLESPIYWKLSNALMDVEYFSSPFVSNHERGRLTAVPGYFHDLARKWCVRMFEEFLEGITVAGKPLEPERQAYRMDGVPPDPHMRRKAGLGACNCCDYFVFGSGNSVILIEETRLAEQVKHLMEEFSYLNSIDQKKHVIKFIQEENRLKAYGSLLVLCRLFCKKENGAAPISLETKYSFWLVASSAGPSDDVITLDHLKDRLVDQLRSVLGAVVDAVEVVPAERLADKLESVGAAVRQT